MTKRITNADFRAKYAPWALSYLLGQRMLKRRHGGIVLMSSLSSSQGSALIANYSATKAYNRLLAEGLWEELRTQGVDVLACSDSYPIRWLSN